MVSGLQDGRHVDCTAAGRGGHGTIRPRVHVAARRAGSSADAGAVVRQVVSHIGEIGRRPTMWIAVAGGILMAVAVFLPWVHVSGIEQVEAMVEGLLGRVGVAVSMDLHASMSLVGLSSATGDVDGLIAALQEAARKLGWTIDERPHMPWQFGWAWLIALLMGAVSAAAVALPSAGVRLGVRLGVLVLGIVVLRGGVVAMRSAAQEDGTRKLIGVATWMIGQYERGGGDRRDGGRGTGGSRGGPGPALREPPQARPGLGPYIFLIGSLLVIAGSVWEVVAERKRRRGDQ